MGKIVVGKEFTFDAAHYLPDYDGDCSRQHGHTYRLIVEVSGLPSPEFRSASYNGIICDFTDLKTVVKLRVLNFYDHANLNDYFERPTAENIVDAIAMNLKMIFHDNLERVRLYETPTCYAEWRKE